MDGGVHWPKKLKKCFGEFINIFRIFMFFQIFLGRCTPLFIFWSVQKMGSENGNHDDFQVVGEPPQCVYIVGSRKYYVMDLSACYAQVEYFI